MTYLFIGSIILNILLISWIAIITTKQSQIESDYDDTENFYN